MKKKLIYIFSLSVIFICCIFSVNAAEKTSSLVVQRPYKESERIKIVDNVVYQLCEDKALGGKFYEVYDWFATPEAAKTATEINIVPEIEGVKVKAVKYEQGSLDYPDYFYYWNEENYSVKKITIPDTVIHIGDGFFSVLDGVEEMEIPASVKYIGMEAFLLRTKSGPYCGFVRAFEGMKNLKKVIFSGAVETLGGFRNCSKLEKIVLKGPVKNIGENAFYGCKSLKSFKIPDTVVKIGGSAFAGSGITSITIPASVKNFGSDEDEGPIFKNCKKLTKVVFTDRKTNLFTIMFNTFENCTALKKVYLPKSAKKIKISDCAFKNCKSLTKVYNTDNIVKISDDALRGCKALTSFTVSAKVTEIGERAFYGCTKLKKVTVNSKKKAPAIGKKAFGKTAEGIRFVAKNSTAAKSWKSAVKKSGLKKLKVCYVKYVNV